MAKKRRKEKIRKEETEPKAKTQKITDKKKVNFPTSGFRITDHNIPYLETDIDKLFNWVKERKSIPVIEAAKKFGVSSNRIKDWGEILEKHKLLEVHYPIFGEPVLRMKPPKKKKGKHKEKEKPEKVKGKSKSKGSKLKISKKIAVVVFLVGFFIWFLIYGLLIDANFFMKFMLFTSNNLFLIITIVIIIIVIIALPVILHRRKKRKKKQKGKHT